MTIWERVETALTGLAIPMAAGAYITADASLPDMFLVYTLISDPPVQAADDGETIRWQRVQVSLYSRTGLAVTPGKAAIDTAMLNAGFTRGPGRELPYNQITRHYGLALDYSYVEAI